jgi:hypothetical protein
MCREVNDSRKHVPVTALDEVRKVRVQMLLAKNQNLLQLSTADGINKMHLVAYGGGDWVAHGHNNEFENQY